ncbi:MAG TPA: metallophosphoesterase [Polyangiaceae bacterium]|jgi:hypothetical protein|nr:metallophosphoesterase [Polyangiaceae bacterium]
MLPPRLISALTASLALIATACSGTDSQSETNAEPVSAQSEAVTAAATLLVAGDFASTSSTLGIAQTEINNNAATKLIAVGDMSYAAPYASNYPWAGFASRTFPVMGNHEFNTVAGKGGDEPFALFNGKNAAGNLTFPAITGNNGVATYDFSYSYEITPGWLLVVVNTGVDCAQQSCTAQGTKVQSQISSWRSNHGGHGCVIVAMHTARWSTMFSSDPDNEPWATSVTPIWSAAIGQKADIILQGHVHVYEEFEKLDTNGNYSAVGAKLFTMGSGGRGQVEPPVSNISSARLVASHASPINGVLKLGLYAGSYGYHFETAATSGAPVSSKACNVP